MLVDGRYTLQARAQIDATLFEVLQTPEAKASKWIKGKLAAGDAIGYDPRLHTIKEIERLTETLGKSGIKLEPQETNPIDRLWRDRPPPSAAPVVPHGIEYAGRSAAEKIRDVQRVVKQEGADAVLITLLDSIAWLFNIRGADIRHTPVAFAYALVPVKGKPSLFIDPAKLGDNVRGSLAEIVDILEPAALDEKLAQLGRSRAKVRLGPRDGAGPLRSSAQSRGRQIRARRRPVHPAQGDQERDRDRGRARGASARRRRARPLLELARRHR